MFSYMISITSLSSPADISSFCPTIPLVRNKLFMVLQTRLSSCHFLNSMEKNIKLTINLLIDNNYLHYILFFTLKQRLKLNFFKNDDSRAFYERTNKQQTNIWFILLYIKDSSEEISARLSSNVGAKTTYTVLNRFFSFIKIKKDSLLHCSNVVYLIKCKNYDASYVGQTNRMLKN